MTTETKSRARPAAAVDQLPPGQDVSGTVIDLAGWVVASGDSAPASCARSHTAPSTWRSALACTGVSRRPSISA